MAIDHEEIYNSTEYRRHSAEFAAVQVAGIILTVMVIFFVSYKIMGETDRRIYHSVSVMEKLYPGSSERIIPIFTGGLDKEEVENGTALFAPYGYKETPFLAKPVFQMVKRPILYVLLLFLITRISIDFFLFRLLFSRLYRRLSELSQCTLSILNGKFLYAKTRYDEGIVDILFNRFNQMVKKLESTLKLLKKEKTFLREIISDISHQLKTPLASLIMHNELMLNDMDMENTTRREFLEICQGQLTRMEWLIISLLKLGRLETGSISFQSIQFDIVKSIEKAIETLGHLKEDRQVTISDERTGKNPFKGDPDWLTEAFSNIIKNAYEYTDPHGGKVLILLKETALFMRITISDNGPGIPEEDLYRVFRRFFRGKNSSSMESVGIGLPLSKMIIEAQGGEIRTDGSSFIITFPY